MNITELKGIQRERENLVKELERSNRELSQFSYAVSHDLQAPVRNVRTLAQLLVRRDDRAQEDSSHLLTLIEHAAAASDLPTRVCSSEEARCRGARGEESEDNSTWHGGCRSQQTELT